MSFSYLLLLLSPFPSKQGQILQFEFFSMENLVLHVYHNGDEENKCHFEGESREKFILKKPSVPQDAD